MNSPISIVFDHTASKEYKDANRAFDKAIKAYERARKEYYALRIGDEEFLAERQKYTEAARAWDKAFDEEQTR